MGKYFIGAETVRLEFPDGNWVDVKEELSQADHDYVINEMGRAEAVGKQTKFTMTLGKLALLEKYVVAWSFKDDKEKPVPVSRDTVSNLRQKYRVKILEKIDLLSNKATEFVSKN